MAQTCPWTVALGWCEAPLFSLPELAFFNIRKGSFEYVDAGLSDARSETQ